MLELNKLYNMDCMQGMKEFPDGFFDLAIVDPPYGIGIDGQKKRVCGNPKHNRKEHIRKSWDKAIPPPEYFRELERVSKAQVIWGGNYFVPYLEQGHKGWLVWDKGQHGLTMSDCELAYTSFDTPTRVFVCNRVELLNDGTIHPDTKAREAVFVGSSPLRPKRYEDIGHTRRKRKFLDRLLSSRRA